MFFGYVFANTEEGRYRLDIGKKLFTLRVMRPWQSLPSCPIPVCQARLDGALGSLGWWKLSLVMAERLKLDNLWGHFQPKPFSHSCVWFIISQ